MKIEEERHGEAARQYAYRTLRGNIVSLDLKPRAPFNNVEMSQMIGVSRTPVQEAVIRLNEESRITEIFPQRGMRITLVNVELVGEACFLRLVLEKAAVELVCGQAGEEDLRRLDENIRPQEFCLEGGSSQKLLELDNRMYRKLFSICRKKLVYEVCQRLAIRYDRIRSLSVVTVKDRKIIEDRKKLLEAMRRRDKKQTVEIMELYLSRWMLNEQVFRNRYPTYLK